MSLLNRVLRVGEGRRLKALEEAARTVNSLEDSITPLSDDELRERYGQLRDQVRAPIAEGEDPEKALRDVQAECFAIIREAGWRSLGMRHFDVQIMGGYTLGDGTIAEMKTGEGKTLVATLAVCFRRWPATACTSSRSTTTWPAATPSGWGRSTASSA